MVKFEMVARCEHFPNDFLFYIIKLVNVFM